MRHEYLSVYNLENDTLNSENINADVITVDEISVGGGGLVTHEHDFAVDGNTSGSYGVFNITGDVRMKVLAICTAGPAGGGGQGQLTLGFNGALTNLIGETTANNIDTGEVWMSASTGLALPARPTSVIFDRIVSGYTALKLGVTSESTSTGKIMFYCWWEPLSDGAAVTEA